MATHSCKCTYYTYRPRQGWRGSRQTEFLNEEPPVQVLRLRVEGINSKSARMENRGIDPRTSHMLSKRSTI